MRRDNSLDETAVSDTVSRISLVQMPHTARQAGRIRRRAARRIAPRRTPVRSGRLLPGCVVHQHHRDCQSDRSPSRQPIPTRKETYHVRHVAFEKTHRDRQRSAAQRSPRRATPSWTLAAAGRSARGSASALGDAPAQHGARQHRRDHAVDNLPDPSHQFHFRPIGRIGGETHRGVGRVGGVL